MPVLTTSRYAACPTYVAEDARRGPQPTLGVRAAEAPPGGPIHQHRISGLEDIEYLSWRYHGASELWWRIADANPRVYPLDLRPGDTLVVSLDADPGRVERNRSF